MIAELPSGLTLHESANFTASSCEAKAFWLQTSKALTHTLKWKLAFFAGAGPAPSASCRTSPTIFSHLSVWPRWGFFAQVAIRTSQEQGLGNLKLSKQWDTFNSCLSCIYFAEVKRGENAGVVFIIMVALGSNLIEIRKDKSRQGTPGRWANEKQCLSPKRNLMQLPTWKNGLNQYLLARNTRMLEEPNLNHSE